MNETARQTDLGRPADLSCAAGTVRVAVVDDHRTLVDLLALALAAEDGFTFVGHAPSVASGLDLVRRVQPDVVLLDLHLPDGNGLWLAREVTSRYPLTRVIVLTAEADPRLVGHAAKAGACGFVAKTGGLDEVLGALRAARLGTMYADNWPIPAQGTRRTSAGAGGTTAGTTAGTVPGTPSLTAREVDVLHELAAGRDVTGTARRLGISPHTARGYVKSILVKLDCHSQLEAVVTAARLGLLRLNQAS